MSFSSSPSPIQRPSATPPPSLPPSSSNAASPFRQGATNRWGTISGQMSPSSVSSGVSVRRNHTIHSNRPHDKPRLEKHFEQPSDLDPASFSLPSHEGEPQPRSPSSQDQNRFASTPSPSTNPSAPFSADEYGSSLAPLQALYSKANLSRVNSLPSRNPTKFASQTGSLGGAQGRSALHNSLSAITGGADIDEHDWEKMIKSDGALGEEGGEAEEFLSASVPADSQWPDSLFGHRRFPSGPASQPLSPPEGVSRASNDLDKGAFASSPIGSNYVRRHQSLKHHSGRTSASRLGSHSPDLLHHETIGQGTASFSTQLEQTISPRQAGSSSATSSPIFPSNYSKAPWNQPSGTPSRFANSFSSPIEARDEHQQQFGVGSEHKRFSSTDSQSRSLMDIHATLAKLDLHGSVQASRTDSIDSRESITPTGFGRQVSSLPQKPPLASRNSSSELHQQAVQSPFSGRKLPSLITNRDMLARGAASTGSSSLAGPVSAAAYVPPIGHAHTRQQSMGSDQARARREPDMSIMGPFSAAPAPGWQQKELIAGRQVAPGSPETQARTPGQWGLGLSPSVGQGIDHANMNTLALSLALAQEQQRTAMMQAQAGLSASGAQQANLFAIQSMGRQVMGTNLLGQMEGFGPVAQAPSVLAGSPAMGIPSLPSTDAVTDISALVLQKGYNPAPGTFDLNPPSARFFVIKSYTEDDVHKSLKYEIWASTDKGNQRLDKAFKESAHLGPIYLFFSVNASGHFCGMAQMLTPLDYTTSSNVWAQDGKWKGTFKVRWIFVKDLPNNQLRHIKLTNTPEVKPVTQSRDTQELTPQAGKEVLRIMSDFPAKTSLLQDFQFYEMQSKQQEAQKMAGGQTYSPGKAADGGASGVDGGKPGEQKQGHSRSTPPNAIGLHNASPGPVQGRQQRHGGYGGPGAPGPAPNLDTHARSSPGGAGSAFNVDVGLNGHPSLAAAPKAGLGPSAF
ncbi:hypothetical protein IE53DRAFT_369471 [Violaceomyces palustris]|uniref:Uncharacterized protein n=1 Tax=Violaceomyces palustris TaxID=1673888 RepID=A0ACD0NVM0_9BASI|nr:hypothetical protein IE53DRAFT_369471 [Violaceomyces palustris]